MSNPAPSANPTRGFFTSHRASIVLGVILICQLMVVLDGTIVNIALPEIQSALHFSDASLSWVVNAYALAFGGLLLLGARVGDIIGRRRAFLLGIALFTVASFAGGFAQNSSELLIGRAVQGIGSALASPSALALLMTMFPGVKERTRAVGAYTAVSVGGAAVGLIAGGMLTEWASWRWVFFVNVPIGIVVLLLGRPTLPETERHTGRFDIPGALLSTAGITGLVYGFVHAASDGWSNVPTIGSFLVGAVLVALFVVVELRASSPITPLRLFTNRNRIAAYIARLLLVAAMMGLFFFLSQFLQEVLNYSSLRTGFAFVPLTVMVFSSSQLSARFLVGRLGGVTVLIAGMIVSALGVLWMTQLHEHSSYLSLLGPLLLFGIGNGSAFVPMTTLALDDVSQADAGAASGLVNVMQQVGGALGLAVLVTIFGTATTHETKHLPAGLAPAEAAKHLFVYASDKVFWTSVGLLVVAILVVLSLVRRRRDSGLNFEEMELELDQTLVEL